MKYFISFDTSSMRTIIALANIDGDKIDERIIETKSHGPVLLPAIDEILKKNSISLKELQFIGCGKGPGTFTGVRIGMATAKSLAYGLNIPLITVSGLDILYFGVSSELRAKNSVIPLIDARRGECYYSVYPPSGEKYDFKPGLIDPSILKSVTSDTNNIIFTGSGATVYNEKLQTLYGESSITILDNNLEPAALLKVSLEKFNNKEFSPIAESQPLYIRASDAEINLLKKLSK